MKTPDEKAMEKIETDVRRRHVGYAKQYKKVESGMEEYRSRIAKEQKKQATNPQRTRAKRGR